MAEALDLWCFVLLFKQISNNSEEKPRPNNSFWTTFNEKSQWKLSLGSHSLSTVIGTMDARDMLSALRNVPLSAVTDSDAAIAWLQGRSMASVKKSLIDIDHTHPTALLLMGRKKEQKSSVDEDNTFGMDTLALAGHYCDSPAPSVCSAVSFVNTSGLVVWTVLNGFFGPIVLSISCLTVFCLHVDSRSTVPSKKNASIHIFGTE